MKTPLSLAIAALLPALAAGEEIKLANGQIVKGEISRVEPDGLVVLTDAGVEKISFFSLPEETQKRYGFDLSKADQHRAAQKAARQQMLEQQTAALRERAGRLGEMERNQPTAEETARRVKIEASAFVAQAHILRGTSKGVHVTLTTQTGRAASTMLDRDSRTLVNLGEGFIHEMPGADGETWTGRLYPTDYYLYITPLGTERMIRGYATTVETALAKGATGRVVAAGTSAPGSTGGYAPPGGLRGETLLDRR
jgi:hypothetical protein